MRTIERNGDRFADSILITRIIRAFNTNVDIPVVGATCPKIEILEMGISVGAITGGTAPGCALELFDSQFGSLVLNTKGTSLYSAINALVCDANRTLLKKFSYGELVISNNCNPDPTTTYAPNFPALSNTNYGTLAKMRVLVSGTPTSIASAYAWVRYRPFLEE